MALPMYCPWCGAEAKEIDGLSPRIHIHCTKCLKHVIIDTYSISNNPDPPMPKSRWMVLVRNDNLATEDSIRTVFSQFGIEVTVRRV